MALSLLSAVEGNVWNIPFETDFILWLQSLGGKGSFLYYLMNFITLFGEEVVLVAVMGLLYWGLDKKAGERICAMLMTATLFTTLIKNVARRTRPFNTATDIQNFRNISGYSFPSGHSSGSASVFVGTAVYYRKKRWKWLTACAIAIPLLVALSRNYLGAHYLTDVICGLALGTGIVFLLQWLLEKINKYYVYIALIVIGAAGLFYCTTEDYYTSFGLMIGFAGGIFFEERITKFENTKIWWRVVLRIALGGIVYLGLNELIKLPFKSLLFDAQGEVLPEMVVGERIFRVIRYAVVNFVAIAIYPMSFRLFDKLWLRLKWIKPQKTDNLPQEQQQTITTDASQTATEQDQSQQNSTDNTQTDIAPSDSATQNEMTDNTISDTHNIEQQTLQVQDNAPTQHKPKRTSRKKNKKD